MSSLTAILGGVASASACDSDVARVSRHTFWERPPQGSAYHYNDNDHPDGRAHRDTSGRRCHGAVATYTVLGTQDQAVARSQNTGGATSRGIHYQVETVASRSRVRTFPGLCAWPSILAFFIKTLQVLGAAVLSASSKIVSAQGYATVGSAKAGTATVLAWKGETVLERWWRIEQVLAIPGVEGYDQVGDAIPLIHGDTGLRAAIAADGTLLCPRTQSFNAPCS